MTAPLKLIFALLAVLGFTPLHCMAQPLTLARDGQTTYGIVLAADAIPAEKTAATLLGNYLKQITGADFPLVDEAQTQQDKPYLWVGAGPGVKRLLPGQNWEALGDEGIVIKSVGPQLVLAGGRPRGAIYAVFQFLEDSLGCRWWSATEKTIPHQPSISLPPQDTVYVPPLEYRDFSRNKHIRYDPKYAEIGVSLRSNGLNNLPDKEWGGRRNIRGFIHSFNYLLPVGKYFKEHPEWFSDPANGFKPATAASPVPRDNQVQPCYNAPGLKEEVIKNATAWLKQTPDVDYISLSINDNRGYCREEESLALAEAEGSHAAPLLEFINSVSRSLREIKPDLKVITLAYYHTIAPPKTVRPDDNITILYAPITANFGYPLQHEKNRETRDNLAAWQAITPKVLVWNYVGNFFYPMLPYPNWDSLAPDIQGLHRDGLIGIFNEGPLSQGDLRSDFQEMRTWIIGHMLWDPGKQFDTLMDAFLTGYYGAAAPHLRGHIRNVQDSFNRQRHKLTAFHAQFDFLSIDTMNRSTQLFDLAEAAVRDNPEELRRVRHERLSLEFSWLHLYDSLKLQSKLGNKPFLGSADPQAKLDELLASFPDAQKKEYKYGLEKYDYEGLRKRVAYDFTTEHQLPDFLAQLPAERVHVFEQGIFTLKEWSKDVTYAADAKASDGKALRMETTATDTLAQLMLEPFASFFSGKSADIYVAARITKKAGAVPAGDILEVGLSHTEGGEPTAAKKVDAAALADEEYHWIKIENQPLKGRSSVNLKVLQNDGVEELYIDRVILVTP